MPRIKAAAPKTAKRPKTEKPAKTKNTGLKKKSKPVLVDVIEDQVLETRPLVVTPAEKLLFTADEPRLSQATSHRPVSFQNSELDNQKKFFSELASGLDSNDKVVKQSESGHRSLSLYRHLVLKFIILVLVVAAAVSYFSFSKLTIHLTLRGEDINDTLLLKVSDPVKSLATTTKAVATTTGNIISTNTAATLADSTDPRESIAGQIKEISTNLTKVYPATGANYLGQELVGQVKIINNSNKSQALVAKTRLLSPDNKLFRLKEAVVVPAGGEVAVAVYADKISDDLAIAPTKFTIPGLWLGLQDKIYAQSEQAFVVDKQAAKYVTAEDIDQATRDINSALLKQAKDQVGVSLGSDNWLYNTDDPAKISIQAKVGDKVDKFTAQASSKIIAVSFSKDQAAKLVAAKLNLIIPDDKELVEFNPDKISYSLDNYDSLTRTASIKASFSGSMILKKDAAVINPEQLVNLNDDQIGSYLKSQVEVKDYRLEFSPAFIKKAPSLVDRISIQVDKN
jgi:hypothetical protein